MDGKSYKRVKEERDQLVSKEAEMEGHLWRKDQTRTMHEELLTSMVANHELFNAEVREYLREEAAVPAMRPAIIYSLSLVNTFVHVLHHLYGITILLS